MASCFSTNEEEAARRAKFFPWLANQNNLDHPAPPPPPLPSLSPAATAAAAARSPSPSPSSSSSASALDLDDLDFDDLPSLEEVQALPPIDPKDRSRAKEEVERHLSELEEKEQELDAGGEEFDGGESDVETLVDEVDDGEEFPFGKPTAISVTLKEFDSALRKGLEDQVLPPAEKAVAQEKLNKYLELKSTPPTPKEARAASKFQGVWVGLMNVLWLSLGFVAAGNAQGLMDILSPVGCMMAKRVNFLLLYPPRNANHTHLLPWTFTAIPTIAIFCLLGLGAAWADGFMGVYDMHARPNSSSRGSMPRVSKDGVRYHEETKEDTTRVNLESMKPVVWKVQNLEACTLTASGSSQRLTILTHLRSLNIYVHELEIRIDVPLELQSDDLPSRVTVKCALVGSSSLILFLDHLSRILYALGHIAQGLRISLHEDSIKSDAVIRFALAVAGRTVAPRGVNLLAGRTKLGSEERAEPWIRMWMTRKVLVEGGLRLDQLELWKDRGGVRLAGIMAATLEKSRVLESKGYWLPDGKDGLDRRLRATWTVFAGFTKLQPRYLVSPPFQPSLAYGSTTFGVPVVQNSNSSGRAKALDTMLLPRHLVSPPSQPSLAYGSTTFGVPVVQNSYSSGQAKTLNIKLLPLHLVSPPSQPSLAYGSTTFGVPVVQNSNSSGRAKALDTQLQPRYLVSPPFQPSLAYGSTTFGVPIVQNSYSSGQAKSLNIKLLPLHLASPPSQPSLAYGSTTFGVPVVHNVNSSSQAKSLNTKLLPLHLVSPPSQPSLAYGSTTFGVPVVQNTNSSGHAKSLNTKLESNKRSANGKLTEVPDDLICCSKVFASKEKFMSHWRSCHITGICPDCEVEFSRASLRKHLKKGYRKA